VPQVADLGQDHVVGGSLPSAQCADAHTRRVGKPGAGNPTQSVVESQSKTYTYLLIRFD
jgi:hypothetical protein